VVMVVEFDVLILGINPTVVIVSREIQNEEVVFDGSGLRWFGHGWR
jgi:hypothetical protein